jgi:hypothetical protein
MMEFHVFPFAWGTGRRQDQNTPGDGRAFGGRRSYIVHIIFLSLFLTRFDFIPFLLLFSFHIRSSSFRTFVSKSPIYHNELLNEREREREGERDLDKRKPTSKLVTISVFFFFLVVVVMYPYITYLSPSYVYLKNLIFIFIF